jgi:hypothetical protein
MHSKKIKIQNITYNFKDVTEFDSDWLGYSAIGVPHTMIQRLIKESGFECLPGDSDLKSSDFTKDKDEIFECYNTDTQIILMNWLHEKRRNYVFDYNGTDPFWIYHDHKHSQKDVYSHNINPIDSRTEFERLLDGAEMAQHYKHHITAKTVCEIANEWGPRFSRFESPNRITEFNEYDFTPFMRKSEVELLEMGIYQ